VAACVRYYTVYYPVAIVVHARVASARVVVVVVVVIIVNTSSS
jgi:hypothetical protein